MIKSFTATTREIDDAQVAVAEILARLDLENNLLNNSVGIVSCFSEFDDTGVLKAICDALPFECVGSTSCLIAAGSEIDQIIFAVTVLTSDDCSFVTTSIPISDNYEDSIASVLTPLLESFVAPPALFLGYFPLINTISGDMILSAVDKVTGGIPLFGTMTVDHKEDYSTAKTIHNGEAMREAAVLCAICGNVEYSFDVASLDKDKTRKQKGIITQSAGSLLIGVNDKTALEYFEEIGLTKSDLATGIGIVPLFIDHMDGTKPVARGVFALTPEGYAVCGGMMPVGTTISLGHIDMEDVLKTTEEALRPLIATRSGAILAYSCMARYLVLGAEYSAEAEKVQALIGDIPYMFACSGGELSPLPDAGGKLKNFCHNYTAVFCRLS
jgi:hypothetical protein